MAPDIRRMGNSLVDAAKGDRVLLKGMSYMGGEYQCVQNHGIFAGPANDRMIDVMVQWGINAIRLPLNEDCWLGLHGVSPKYSGVVYRNAIITFVERLLSRGVVVVLDLHWTSSTGSQAAGQDFFLGPNSIAFWEDVARTPQLRSRAGVVFELFNEPYCFAPTTEDDGALSFEPSMSLSDNVLPYHVANSKCERQHHLSVSCFLEGDGCRFSGYNQVVRAIRHEANATNLLLFAGRNWNYDLPYLMANFPTDPLQNCAVSWHPYEFKCPDFDCVHIASAVTAQYPIFVTEWAPEMVPSAPDLYTAKVLQWADTQPSSVALFPWVWNPGHGKHHVLSAESDYYASHPTPWGEQYKSW
eukprot:CAMPEP_0119304546 /NCGR_PEP_ID=MMETSP1333-20130426/5742_1 /TAXON_ID=418940 /ORGANISM="Scyphosphaera apsteinii, Strain RCC1455" /LENGTH=355 /DNA_ID=CAMNT_0007307451 /DNA_START=80 /DNA_END=1144 /DNA_ORIENTATION=+